LLWAKEELETPLLLGIYRTPKVCFSFIITLDLWLFMPLEEFTTVPASVARMVVYPFLTPWGSFRIVIFFLATPIFFVPLTTFFSSFETISTVRAVKDPLSTFF